MKVSFEMPEFTADSAGMGTLRMLEAVRTADWPIRFYQAGSSEMYGASSRRRRARRTPFQPRSPYAIAKVFAHWMTIQYRDAYGLHAEQRDPVQPRVSAARRDIRHPKGDAGDRGDPRRANPSTCSSAISMPAATGATQPNTSRRCGGCSSSPNPTTTSIATGEMHTVRELCEVAFDLVGLDWEKYVRVDERYFRPTEVDELCGDASKAERASAGGRRRGSTTSSASCSRRDLREAGLDPNALLRAVEPVV